MAGILCLETATKNCSVALAVDGKVIAEKSHCDIGYSHAEQLHPFVQEVLSNADVSLNDVDAIAISAGPGSYTGLRIGVSAAKGMAYALDIPLISVPTLQGLTQEAIGKQWLSEGLICPMIDARRMEVYTALYDVNGIEQMPLEAKIIDETSFLDVLENNKVLFLGDGADKCQEVIQHSNAQFQLNVYPEARSIASIAERKFQNAEFEDLAYFEPLYLKQFVAGKPKNPNKL